MRTLCRFYDTSPELNEALLNYQLTHATENTQLSFGG